MALPKEGLYPGYDYRGQSLFYGKAELDPRPRMELQRYATLRLGSAKDLELIQVPARGHFLFGLREYIRIQNAEVPTYVFDGHNHAFFGWVEAYKEGHIKGNSILAH